MAAFSNDELNAFLAPENATALTELLQLHVVPRKLLHADLADGMRLQALGR